MGASRSLYTIVLYLTGKRDGDARDPPFAGGETNLLENSYSEKLLYTDDDGNFQENTKRVFASVVPERGAALIFYQKGLLHEGADIRSISTNPTAQSHLCKKIIMRSDIFFQCTGGQASNARTDALETSSISSADRMYAEQLIAESEEYEEAGDFETAAEIYEKAMAILNPP